MLKRCCIAVLVSMSVVNAWADVEKNAVACKEKLCFYWWPKLVAIKGWHQDREQSFAISANAQAPDGFTFANADAVIYAKAEYKPKIPGIRSVSERIADDKKTFQKSDPTLQISEAAALQTADGQKLRSFSFFPKEHGNWELVSYGEEGEFYLIFSLSARTLVGYENALSTYKQFISSYKEKP